MTKEGRTFFVKDMSKDFHTQFGFIAKKDLKKKGTVVSNTKKEFFIFDPFFIDAYKKIKRQPQIITLKDVAAIVAETGISRKSVIVDAGAGSGALSCFLAHLAKKVTCYDVRDDFIAVVKANKKMLGLKNLTIKKGSIYEEITQKNVDVMTLDVPEPWKAISTTHSALKQGGFLVSYSPTIVQAADFVNAVLRTPAFIHVKTIELIQREWEINERKVRPKTSIINHTGFLSFARKMDA